MNVILKAKGFQMSPEAERETLRQMIIGALALDPAIRDKALDVLSDIADNDRMNKRNHPTGDRRGEQAA